jgi:hypothetical protein
MGKGRLKNALFIKNKKTPREKEVRKPGRLLRYVSYETRDA